MSPRKLTISALISTGSVSPPAAAETTTTAAMAATTSSAATPLSQSPKQTQPPLPCKWENCTEVFDDARSLYTHLCDSHIGRKCNKNLSLRCRWDHCSTVTIKRDHITSHIRVHIPFKPYSCRHCEKTFKRPQDLKKHEKKHINNELKRKQKLFNEKANSFLTTSGEKPTLVKGNYNNFDNFSSANTNRRLLDDNKDSTIYSKRQMLNSYQTQQLLPPSPPPPPSSSSTNFSLSSESPMSTTSTMNSERQYHLNYNSYFHSGVNQQMCKQYLPHQTTMVLPPTAPPTALPAPPAAPPAAATITTTPMPSQYPIYIYPPYQTQSTHPHQPPTQQYYQQCLPTYQYISTPMLIPKPDSGPPSQPPPMSMSVPSFPLLLQQNDPPTSPPKYSTRG